MASSLEKIYDLCLEKKKIQNDIKLSSVEISQKISQLKIGDASIEDLELDFTLPGMPNWELKVKILIKKKIIQNKNSQMVLIFLLLLIM